MQNVTSLRAVPHPAATTSISVPRVFFTDTGKFLVLNLAKAVTHRVICGFNDRTERFYTYDNGVWTPNGTLINAVIVDLLGNSYRTSHKNNTLDVIRHLQATTRIDGGEPPDARYINTPGGMVNWDTGEVLNHSPDFRSTVQLPVTFEPDATCPAFEKFLSEVLPADCVENADGSPGFIWELIGYTMYSGNPLHIAVLLHGIGRNGKGTFIRVLNALLGAHNTSSVGLQELTENRFRAATLYGKLANLAGDLDSRWIENTAAFKAITGGDQIQAEHKYGQPFDFTPWALPIYSANKPFGSADSSEGWHARWVIVPFPNTFLDEPDRGLDAVLCSEPELQGVMRRGIEALPRLMARGHLQAPASVADAKRKFIAASDAVRAWIDDSCDTTDPSAWSARANLYSAYRTHTFTDGSKTLSAREFYSRVAQIGGITPRKNNVDGFTGIKLKGHR
jgi:putative DNA primase/helicase